MYKLPEAQLRILKTLFVLGFSHSIDITKYLKKKYAITAQNKSNYVCRDLAKMIKSDRQLVRGVYLGDDKFKTYHITDKGKRVLRWNKKKSPLRKTKNITIKDKVYSCVDQLEQGDLPVSSQSIMILAGLIGIDKDSARPALINLVDEERVLISQDGHYRLNPEQSINSNLFESATKTAKNPVPKFEKIELLPIPTDITMKDKYATLVVISRIVKNSTHKHFTIRTLFNAYERARGQTKPNIVSAAVDKWSKPEFGYIRKEPNNKYSLTKAGLAFLEATFDVNLTGEKVVQVA